MKWPQPKYPMQNSLTFSKNVLRDLYETGKYVVACEEKRQYEAGSLVASPITLHSSPHATVRNRLCRFYDPGVDQGQQCPLGHDPCLEGRYTLQKEMGQDREEETETDRGRDRNKDTNEETGTETER